ncbi:MAG: TVP38/TMEM64 family protein [Legionellales bacterium]|nr:TVP38/TMEM64 family protein [Legionellales bacterium]
MHKTLLRKSDFIKAVVVILLSIFILMGYLLFAKYWDIGFISQHIKSFGLFAPLLFILMYMLSTVSLIPAACMSFIGGYIFGFYNGLILNIIGSLLGVFSAFIIGRYITKGLVKRSLGNKANRFIQSCEKFGWKFIAVFRLTPLIPFDIMNYAFGITNVKTIQYIFISSICMLPGLLTYTYLGNLGMEIFVEQPRVIVIKGLITLFIALSVLTVLPKIIAIIRKKLHLEEVINSVGDISR